MSRTNPPYNTMLQGDIHTPSSYRHFLLPPIKRALDWISEFGPQIEGDAVDPTRHEIPGISKDDMYALVITADLTALAERQFETHRQFWDVHYCSLGTEEILWLPLHDLLPKEADEHGNGYNEEKDVILFPLKDGFSRIILLPERFAAFSPGDAHIPGLRLDNGFIKSKKIVIKIHRRLFE